MDLSTKISDFIWIDISKYSAWDEEELRKAIVDAWHKWEWMDKQATATMIL